MVGWGYTSTSNQKARVLLLWKSPSRTQKHWNGIIMIGSFSIPICSGYGISTGICSKNLRNVGKYTIQYLGYDSAIVYCNLDSFWLFQCNQSQRPQGSFFSMCVGTGNSCNNCVDVWCINLEFINSIPQYDRSVSYGLYCKQLHTMEAMRLP